MRLDGGRVAARGFQYQYLRTLESILSLLDDTDVESFRVEGPASRADAVDFDVVGGGPLSARCSSQEQISWRSIRNGEAIGALVHLVSGYEAESYEVQTNGIPTPAVLQLASVLGNQ